MIGNIYETASTNLEIEAEFRVPLYPTAKFSNTAVREEKFKDTL